MSWGAEVDWRAMLPARGCARGHTEQRTLMNPEPPLAMAAPGLALCMACVTRLRWRLQEVPELLGHMRQLSRPGLGSSAGREARVDGTRDWAEPVNRAAMDDVDELWASLALFAQRIAQLLHLRTPQQVGSALVAGVATAAGAADVQAGARRVVEWMDSWLEEVAEHEQLVVWMHDDLVPLVGKLRTRYGFTGEQRRARPRPCESCGQQQVRVRWEAALPELRCEGCGLRLPIDWEVVAGGRYVADVHAGSAESATRRAHAAAMAGGGHEDVDGA